MRARWTSPASSCDHSARANTRGTGSTGRRRAAGPVPRERPAARAAAVMAVARARGPAVRIAWITGA